MTTPAASGTAGQHVVRRVATARPDERVEQALAALTGQAFDCLENLHVLDRTGRLIGLVPLPRLLAARGQQRLAELMDVDPFAVRPDLSQERLLTLAGQHQITAPPVVDDRGRLLGCVPPRALVEIGRREHAEDLSRLAGIVHQDHTGEHALKAPPWRRALHRLPWLLVGLLGSAVATLVVARFEDRLSAHLAVAFFIPAIVYLADAVGTQTEAIVVRGLSFHAPRFRSLVAGELSAGGMIGVALGAMTLPMVYLGFGDGWLALAVALTVVVAGSMASACGLVFPWLLSRAGLDPAFGSGPVATVVQDVLSLLLYFTIVQLVVPIRA